MLPLRTVLRAACVAMLVCIGLLGASCGSEFESGDPPRNDAGSDSTACIPTSCDKLGAECGVAPNGCGETVVCGTCASGLICGGGGQNKCGSNPCTPTTCTVLGATCGVLSDGCGGVVNCGSCDAPETCGGGGTPNACGCVPATCQPGMCGEAPDGCGGSLECGDCPDNQICGGNGPNQCGDKPCQPKTCDSLGKNCGTTFDGCGSALSCGSCAAPQTCGGGGTPNVCGCTPDTCAGLGFDCGSVADGCGGTLTCGGCTAPETCGGGGNPNVCGCAPKICESNQCGLIDDGCGGTLVCSFACGTGEVCNADTNQCVPCTETPCTAGAPCVQTIDCGSGGISVYCPCPNGSACDPGTGSCQ